MAFALHKTGLATFVKHFVKHVNIQRNQVRNVMSKQLVFSEFGNPIDVVKCREVLIPKLGPQDVLVRMLAAPINPADINTIQGVAEVRPKLPSVGGNEGVGMVVEIGEKVIAVKLDQRVLIANKHLGSWRCYGVYHERDLYVVTDKIPLAECSMLSIAPCTALRLLSDFRRIYPLETVALNAANSAVGQSVIQLCRTWGINTYNIISCVEDPEQVKRQLYELGATAVYTLPEAMNDVTFNTSLCRPLLALNCQEDIYEEILVKMLPRNGTIVYYGCAYNMSPSKVTIREDIHSHRFDLMNWNTTATNLQKRVMFNEITTLMALGEFRAPMYEPVEIRNYPFALKNTASCEAFSTKNYVFDLTLPF